MDATIDFLTRHAGLLVSLALGASAILLLLPRDPDRPLRRAVGGLVGGLALVVLTFTTFQAGEDVIPDGLFLLFAGLAVASGTLTVTHRNPVYASLWFALATLSVCGLFMLRSALFLGAAAIVVYAGAIIVTFLFIILLAQQQGLAAYDRRAVRPVATTVTAFVLLGALLVSMRAWTDAGRAEPATAYVLPPPEIAATANPFSTPDEGTGGMRALGRSLFGDYLFAVEMAGTLLLVAAVGAIAIAPRRAGGHL